MDNNIPAIRVLLEGVPADFTLATTAESQRLQSWQNPSLPAIAVHTEGDNDGIARSIEKRLREHEVRDLESSKRRFWPPKLFDHLFDRDTVYQVVDQLIKDGKLPVNEVDSQGSDEVAKRYWTDKIWGSSRATFRRVLAMLLLIQTEDRIKDFIDKSLTDDCLPLNEDVFSFPNWRDRDTDSFQIYQWRFIVPFFAPKSNGVPHYDLSEDHITPWIQTSDRPQTSLALQESQLVGSNLSAISQLQNLEIGGGYGEVFQVIIHPWQHSFHDTLQSVRLVCFHDHPFQEDTQLTQSFPSSPRTRTSSPSNISTQAVEVISTKKPICSSDSVGGVLTSLLCLQQSLAERVAKESNTTSCFPGRRAICWDIGKEIGSQDGIMRVSTGFLISVMVLLML